MRVPLLIFVLLVALPGSARAEDAVAEEAPPEPPSWELALSSYLYFVHDDVEYLQPTITADHAWLHLEARYNYEDLETASAWVGFNLEVGEEVSFGFTPLLGAVFGSTNAVGFGYRMSLDWRWLAVYTEGELVIGAGAIEDSFFYAWSELTVSPVDWLSVGAVAQRTRAYATERAFQVGAAVGVSIGPALVRCAVFDPWADARTLVVSMDLELL